MTKKEDAIRKEVLADISVREKRAKMETAEANAKRIQFENEARQGKLLYTHEAEIIFLEALKAFADSVKSLPAKMSSRMPPEKRQKITRILKDDIARALAGSEKKIKTAILQSSRKMATYTTESSATASRPNSGRRRTAIGGKRQKQTKKR